MTHADVCEQAKAWHQANFPDRTIHPNRTGVAEFRSVNKETGKIEIRMVPYGLPAPSMRKKLKKASGGGNDFYSFGSENRICSVWCIECKTLNDDIRPNQIMWADYMVSMGARYYIARETAAGTVEYSRYYPSDDLSPCGPTPP